MNTKLIIGSANFGLTYGIANKKKLTPKEIDKILTLGMESGVWGVDTAQSYGQAENIIGNFIKRYSAPFQIITKLSDHRYSTYESVNSAFEDSQRKLGVSHIDYVLLHSYKVFDKYKTILIPVLMNLKKQGKIHNWGVSLYYPSEAIELLSQGLSDIAIEFPLNILDRRFLKNKVIDRLKQKKYYLFSRSVFLQGLLFLSPHKLPPYFRSVNRIVNKLHELSQFSKINIADISLLFVLSQKLIDGVIIGVDSPKQLLGNLESLSQISKYQQLENKLDILEVFDEKIVLPFLWPIQNPTGN